MDGLLTALVVVVTVAASVIGGRWTTVLVLRAADRSGSRENSQTSEQPVPTRPDVGAEGPGAEMTGADSARSRAVLRGGTWIGYLERIAITGCVLIGFAGGLALVVAIKGLGRYPELRENPGASERFVIGSLASAVWAGAWGYLGIVLIGLI